MWECASVIPFRVLVFSLCRLSCAEEAVYSPSAYCCVGWVTGVKSGRCELDGAIVLIESRECAEEAMYSPSSGTSSEVHLGLHGRMMDRIDQRDELNGKGLF